jgi:hypothetical protein
MLQGTRFWLASKTWDRVQKFPGGDAIEAFSAIERARS